MNTNSLTTESVSKLFFRYLIPAILGTMVTSIYILADTIIIGKGIGIDAMAALNIVLPLFNIFFGNGLLFGVGGSVLMAIARGRGDAKTGECYFTVALILNIITCIFYTIFLWIFMEPIAKFLGATEVTMPYVMNYAPYVIAGLSVFAFSTFLQTFVRNDGAPKLAMTAVVTGGISNVFLDLLFVYPLDMGMASASIASVIGSGITVCILLCHFCSKSNGLKLSLQGFSFSYVKDIFASGFTSFLVDITSGIVMFVFNIEILKTVGDVGYPDRILAVRSLGIKTAFAICSVATIIGLAVPNLFTYIFLNPNGEILAMSPTAIRTYFVGFFVTGINMFIVGYFQSIVKPGISLLLCLLRGCVLSILFVKILSPLFGIVGIWASVPLAELVTLLIAFYFIRKTGKESSL